MRKIQIFGRKDLEGFKTDPRGVPLYFFYCGVKKEFLNEVYGAPPGDPYLTLGVTTDIGNNIFKVISKIKKNATSYFYPIFYLGNTKTPVEDILEIDEINLRNIREGICKILILQTYEGWNYEDFFKILIDTIIKKYNLNYKNFVIVCGNVDNPNFESLKVYYNYWEQHMRVHDSSQLRNIGYHNINRENRNYRFICLNRRPHPHRLLLSAMLYKYKHKGILTLAKETDYGSSRVYLNSLNQLEIKYPKLLNLFRKEIEILCSNLPLVYYDGINAADDNPVIDDNPTKFYDSWFHIVTETFQESKQTFFSEKIFKPVIYYQPFILIGSYQSLKKFRTLGYKTFNGIIDESYDNIQNDEERLLVALKEIERLINLSDLEIRDLYQNCYDILVHNFNHWIYRQHTIHLQYKTDLLNIISPQVNLEIMKQKMLKM